MKSKNISELKRYNPTTPSLRGRVIPNYSSVSNVLRDKNLTSSIKNSSGRNSTGRITCRHKGGRHKRSLRYIDLNRNTGYYSNVSCLSYEYDPNRSSMIGRCFTGSFKPFYIIAPTGMKKGSLECSLSLRKRRGIQAEHAGAGLCLRDITAGSTIYNINGKLCRSAGSGGVLLKVDEKEALIRLPSKVVISLKSEGYATLGKASNSNHKLRKQGKAGANRWLGIRPTVRGIVQNAVDHPNGGKSHGGSQPKTKWGKWAKWVKTARKIKK